MRVALCFPYIASKREALAPAVKRFVDTYKEFPAEHEHDLIVTISEGSFYNFDAEAREDFEGVDFEPISYHGVGRDIGSHQHTANTLSDEFDFAVFVSTQAHFHRAGWLKRLIAARAEFGPGMYGGMGSFQNKPHIRTCFFGMDLGFFRTYPHVINSRVRALQFESREIDIVAHVRSQGGAICVVYWDGFYGLEHCRIPANTFRKGDQSNCLTWDHHTDIYRDEIVSNKVYLEALADGKV